MTDTLSLAVDTLHRTYPIIFFSPGLTEVPPLTGWVKFVYYAEPIVGNIVVFMALISLLKRR